MTSLALAVPLVSAVSTPSSASSTPNEKSVATDAPTGARLMIVGDSISATQGRYARVATAQEPAVWWSTFLRRKDMAGAGLDPTDTRSVVLDAVPGSGFGQVSCTGRFTPFIDRIDKIRQARPEVLVVAGGRNDAFMCQDGAKVPATQAVITQQVTAYFKALDQVTREIGMKPADVFVLTPWGTKHPLARARVVPEVQRVAASYGFTWIQTPGMSVTRAPDGIHPDGGGSAWLADQVWRAGTLQQRLRGVRVTAPVGHEQVATASTRGFTARATERFWGRPTTDPQNWVTFVRSHAFRTEVPPALSSSARSWAEAFGADGASISTLPRVGDIAWWGVAPSNSRQAPSTGHVAVVERVAESEVVVTEWTGSSLRTVRYSHNDLPDVYIRPRTVDGSPSGTLTSVDAVGRSGVRIRGFATDTDAYDQGVELRVILTRSGQRLTSPLQSATRFGFDRTIKVPQLRAGTYTAKVYAYNAPGSDGERVVLLGTRSVKVG